MHPTVQFNLPKKSTVQLHKFCTEHQWTIKLLLMVDKSATLCLDLSRSIFG
jgi:hypothetical protein